ncbi:uncharacterized protein LOC128219244 [Mya arenaria]|uniref:uncharacterized protein LOC128219244 n=1 Tax=Mya arenaria TaxID=6604 RepID=UPI0022DF6903|nr:uncharacterized protein LOC128219244 [Mya arenaria]
MCMQCCNSSYCNNQGCGVTVIPSTQRGPYCFQCDGIEDPNNCTHVAMCMPHEHCMLYSKPNVLSSTTHLYTGLCDTTSACDAVRNSLLDTECPVQCCSTDFCNNACSAATATQTENFVCPPDHLYDNVTSLCIRFIETANLTYNESVEVCHNIEDELVTIDSPEKRLFVEYAIVHYSTRPDYERNYWMGLRSILVGGTPLYQWPYHLPPNFTNWGHSEPDGNNQANCVFMNAHHQYQWYDTGCSKKQYSICEHRPKPTLRNL